ncbi:hypothetical protein [Erysiphe necator associated tombus-like virus 1]|nr:hypothetical protein [Erysiphe necator associated tombus-like virus 1]
MRRRIDRGEAPEVAEPVVPVAPQPRVEAPIAPILPAAEANDDLVFVGERRLYDSTEDLVYLGQGQWGEREAPMDMEPRQQLEEVGPPRQRDPELDSLLEEVVGGSGPDGPMFPLNGDIIDGRRHLRQQPRYLEASAVLRTNAALNEATRDLPTFVPRLAVMNGESFKNSVLRWLSRYVALPQVRVDTHLAGLMATEAVFKPRNIKLLLSLINYGKRVMADYDKRTVTSAQEHSIITETALAVYAITPVEGKYRDWLTHPTVRRRIEEYNREIQF